MQTENLTSLERNVYGTNLINSLTIDNLKLVLPQLQKYINKKVHLTDGSKAKSFKVELLTFTDKDKGQNLRTYLHFSYGNLYLKSDVTVKDKVYSGGGYGVNYYTKDICIGKVLNGILTSVETFENIKTTYKLDFIFDAKVVKETKEKIQALKDEATKLQSTLNQLNESF